MLIRNGAERLPPNGRNPGATGAPLILLIGRLERYKGHHRVIAAMPLLVARVPGACLVIVGRGEYEPALRDLVRRLGLDAVVTFTSCDAEDRDLMGGVAGRIR